MTAGLRQSSVVDMTMPSKAVIRQVSTVSTKRLALTPPADVADLYQQLTPIFDHVNDLAAVTRTNPLGIGTLIGPITFGAAQQQAVNHYLAKPWTGFICTSAQTAAWSGFATPSALDASSVLLTSDNAGTYSFWIF